MGEENHAIGIFDSGVGGLTVFRRIAERLPEESILYLGDTARVPYGTKSRDTVIRYARGCAGVLMQRGVKLLVIACNTASAFALDALRAELEIPVIGVVEPGARAAVRKSRNACIGVIGTAGTVASGAYADVILALNPEARVYSKPCPLFVPLAEEGWTDGEVPRAIARVYLEELVDKGIDTLVLGCTHYPLLADTVAATLGGSAVLVDSAEETAVAVEETLRAMQLMCTEPAEPRYRFMVTDAPDGIARVGRRFLGWDLGEVEWVDV